MESLPKRIALVYDRINKWGGAEKVLLALHDLFPTAPLYTSVYDKHGSPWAEVFPAIIPSFLNSIPLTRNHHELIPFLTPLAFESFNFSQFDAVISITSAEAKGIITKPGVFHCCYCLTPTRYLYSHHEEYKHQLGSVLELISRPSFNYLKTWDKIACHRPDAYIAISQTVQKRIKRYYGQDSQVVYPPVNVDNYLTQNPARNTSYGDAGGYFLWVGRFVNYKHPEIVIAAFNKLKLPLTVVGSGRLNWGLRSLENKITRMADSNITFLSNVSDTELIDLYRHSRAFVFYHEEDFGITAVEAMAAGIPVIALDRGGASETVLNGVTGVLGRRPDVAGLIDTVHRFENYKFQISEIQKHAQKYSLERFNQEFVKVFEYQWQIFRNTFMS
jgi:glycosyltransferase involved in cell wall biosynthesis